MDKELGVDSIRLDGVRVENLPIAESAIAGSQIPVSIETEAGNKKLSLKARYPKASVEYIESRLKECKENLNRMSTASEGIVKQIGEYRLLIQSCRERDIKIDSLLEDEFKKELVSKMYSNLPPYQVGAMERQVEQWEESLDRFTEVSKQEYMSISELTATLAVCKMRDTELKNIQ